MCTLFQTKFNSERENQTVAEYSIDFIEKPMFFVY